AAAKLQRARYWDSVSARAREVEMEHAGRVQYVLGRMIVNITTRGMRRSPDGIFDNGRLIASALALETRMNQEFRTHHQSSVGQEIVAASLDHDRSVRQSQEALGKALVNVAQAQET